MNTVAPVIFETERLYAREFSPNDVEAVFAYCGVAANTEYMDWGPESVEDVEKFVYTRLAHQIEEKRSVFDFALCLKDTDELIGAMGLYVKDEGRQAELGYLLNMHYWHMGYATEAANGFLRFGFLGLDLHRIFAVCDTENNASAHVMERIGMRREACFKSSCRTHVRQKLQWRSQYHYAILQSEYLNRLADGDHSCCRAD